MALQDQHSTDTDNQSRKRNAESITSAPESPPIRPKPRWLTYFVKQFENGPEGSISSHESPAPVLGNACKPGARPYILEEVLAGEGRPDELSLCSDVVHEAPSRTAATSSLEEWDTADPVTELLPTMLGSVDEARAVGDDHEPSVKRWSVLALVVAAILGVLLWQPLARLGRERAKNLAQDQSSWNSQVSSASDAVTNVASQQRIVASKSQSDAEIASSSAGENGRIGDRQLASSGIATISSVHESFSVDSAKVTISLDREAGYELQRLSAPDRIYLDLHSAKLAPDLIGKSLKLKDGWLHKIRIAERRPEVARVTLETNGYCEYFVASSKHPYNITIELRHFRQ